MSASDRRPADFENRLDGLRNEAITQGIVAGAGVSASAGPMPQLPRTPENQPGAGYYGLPLLKPPVWKWMIAVYFFVGGLGGMSALIGAAALLKHDWATTRAAMWVAGVCSVLSPILLTWDLGRPLRFLNMLRVLKFQSPMSVGSWIVSGFGAAAVPGLVLTEWYWRSLATGSAAPVLHGFATAAVISSAVFGIFMGTYTGALIAVTAVPAWHLHRGVLPFHFGAAALGSAAGLLELLGLRLTPLHAIGYAAAGVETLVLIWLELRKHGAADRALHHGKSGWTLRIGELLEGPVALMLRAAGLIPAAAASFVLGALVTRFGWLAAGRSSANDPASVFAAQGATPVSHD